MDRPSEAPYTAAASPAGPAPTTARSNTVDRDVDRGAERGGELRGSWDRRGSSLPITSTSGVPPVRARPGRRSPSRRASRGRGDRSARRGDPGPRGSPGPRPSAVATILTASTTGSVVHAHSPRSSVMAAWNSSSRGPVGFVSTVSTTPRASARDTAGICSASEPPLHQQHAAGGAGRRCAPGRAPPRRPTLRGRDRPAPSPPARPRRRRPAGSIGVVAARHDLDPVVAPVPAELVQQPGALDRVGATIRITGSIGCGLHRMPTHGIEGTGVRRSATGATLA